MSMPMLLATLIVIMPNTNGSRATVGVNPRNDPASVSTPSPEQEKFSGAGKQSSVEVLRQYTNRIRIPMRSEVKKYPEGEARPECRIPAQAGDLVMAQGSTRKALGTVDSIAGPGSFITVIAGGR